MASPETLRYDLRWIVGRLLEINNRKCEGSLATCPRYTFPGSPDAWKAWVACNQPLPLVSDVNVVASPGMTGALPQTCFGTDKKENGQKHSKCFSFCFFFRNKSLLCCDIFIPTVKFVATESKKE